LLQDPTPKVTMLPTDKLPLVVGALVFAGTRTTGAGVGPTCVELASVEVPAELVAVANALKNFVASSDVMVYVPEAPVVEALRGSLVSTGLVPL
jgi:hypothetical protein